MFWISLSSFVGFCTSTSKNHYFFYTSRHDPYYHDIRNSSTASQHHPIFRDINNKQEKCCFLTCNSASSTSSLATLAKWWRRQVNCVNLMVNWSSKWSHALGITPFILRGCRWCYPVDLLRILFRILINLQISQKRFTLLQFQRTQFRVFVGSSKADVNSTVIKAPQHSRAFSSRCTLVN